MWTSVSQLFLKFGAGVGTGDGGLAGGRDVEGEGVPHRCLDAVLQLDRFLVGDVERVFALRVVENLGEPVHVQINGLLELRGALDEIRLRPIDRIAEHHIFALAAVVVVVVEVDDLVVLAPPVAVQETVVDLRVPGKGRSSAS